MRLRIVWKILVRNSEGNIPLGISTQRLMEYIYGLGRKTSREESTMKT
jgi:hypothetical protein